MANITITREQIIEALSNGSVSVPFNINAVWHWGPPSKDEEPVDRRPKNWRGGWYFPPVTGKRGHQVTLGEDWATACDCETSINRPNSKCYARRAVEESWYNTIVTTKYRTKGTWVDRANLVADFGNRP